METNKEMKRPINQSYKVDDMLYAGEYPGDKDEENARWKIMILSKFGIRHFIDLTEEGELKPYEQLLPEGTTYLRFPIKDCGVPSSVDAVDNLLARMDEMQKQGGLIYVHCWGGVGRTGTIVACYLAKQTKSLTLEQVLTELRRLFSAMPKSSYRRTPETKEQINFIEQFIKRQAKNTRTMEKVTKYGITPENITSLKPNEVFVFGSNLSGYHGSGAAAFAMKQFGAVWGQGVGLQGQSYAIPTMQGGVETIKPYVDEFIAFAKTHTDKHFYVTKIGCGIAGFATDEIAPLFKEALHLPNVSLPEEFIEANEEKKEDFNLDRFLKAQDSSYSGYKTALKEMEDGGKQSHWIWYIFPQIVGLGYSAMSKTYAISGYDEAEAYLNHPVLGARLREITNVVLEYPSDADPNDFMGSSIDAVKLKSCMTLFDEVSPDDIFGKVLTKFFGGKSCHATLQRLMFG